MKRINILKESLLNELSLKIVEFFLPNSPWLCKFLSQTEEYTKLTIAVTAGILPHMLSHIS